MSRQRYSPEFKDEVVRQVIDHGHSVAEVADRLGVSSHSLHKWVKAVKPDKTDEQAAQLLEAKSEILKLRARIAPCGRGARYSKKGRKVLCKPARVKYQFINEHRQQHGVAILCRLLKVARTGFYKWLHQPLSDRAIKYRKYKGPVESGHPR